MSKILKEYISALLNEEFFLYGRLGRMLKDKSGSVAGRSGLGSISKLFSKDFDVDEVADAWMKSEEERLSVTIPQETRERVESFSRKIQKKVLDYADDDVALATKLLQRALRSKFDEEIKGLKSSVKEVAGNYSMTGLRRMDAPGNVRSGFNVRGSRASIAGDAASDASVESQNRESLPQAAVTFLSRGGKVLGVSRGSDLSNINMPGGGVEPGEDPRDAAVRELHEETGLTAEKVVPLFSSVRGGKLVHFFRVSSFSGELRSSEEGVASWADPKDILSSEYGDSLRQVLAALRGDVISR